jgi:16S rRNA (adenine1518-N6/adenine1519-N6)-dimethyltransferase
LPHPVKDHRTLENVVRTSFSMRRKTLRNNLKKVISSEQLEKMGIDPSLRPERLGLAEFAAISDYVFEHPMSSTQDV